MLLDTMGLEVEEYEAQYKDLACKAAIYYILPYCQYLEKLFLETSADCKITNTR